MDREEAYVHLEGPECMFSVKMVKEICDAFGVAFPTHLVQEWKSARELYDWGFISLKDEEEGSGVVSTQLCFYIAEQFGIAPIKIPCTREALVAAYVAAIRAKR